MRALIITLVCLSGCGGGDDTTPPPDEGTYQLLGSGRPSALLAVWASSAQDVWVVGGREGPGLGPTVFHYDGVEWAHLDTGLVNVDLWQVFGFAGGDVFFGGSNGTILRFRAGAFEKLTTPTTDIVFGLWGSSQNDVWAVGGQVTGNPFVWRYQGGTSFAAVPGVPATLTQGAVWKVTGHAADDVFMSASQGLVLHWDGQALSNETIGGSEESLFSIGCQTDGCLTAGTNGINGVLYQNDGQGWVSNVPTEDGPAWRGVTPVGDNVYVVGAFGSVLHLVNGTFTLEKHMLTSESLHAAWADPDGDLFTVGGMFDQIPTVQGVLIFKGTATLPPLP